ncbi:glutamate decarboxylase [Acidiplasma sp.]|jgi:glutamate decarboxylase|uniref:glutamate decarboxylase n=1 Tax=Acidiplasma TaxID=507753 RepID=UPI003164F8FB
MVSVKKDSEKKVYGTYSNRYFDSPVPENKFPENGMPSQAAYEMIHQELNLDGIPELNLATFVTTYMEPEADKLYMENAHKNFIDSFEYPQIKKEENRIVNILARLYNAPEEEEFTGTSTIGSSEAIMLALLAHKWNWKQRMKSRNKDYSRPNIVFGADTHVVWDKFAKYFDVEPRVIPVDKETMVSDPAELIKNIDENTMAVGAVLGTTFTGAFDNVFLLNKMLNEYEEKTGNFIPLHVDAASAGFITPFIEPDLLWDFRLNHVASINVSGHKFGLVYPGLGWLIFRDKKYLPEDLIFYVNYLGNEMPTYTLNFSRSASNIAAQYYNILRMGRSGYKKIAENMMGNARYLANEIKKMDNFELVSSAEHIPVITFKQKHEDSFNLFDLSSELRKFGWIIPAYSLPENASDTVLMRIVVRESFSRDMADLLINHIRQAVNNIGKRQKFEIRSPRKGHAVT